MAKLKIKKKLKSGNYSSGRRRRERLAILTSDLGIEIGIV